MSDEFSNNMMLRFLERNYPISRIKTNMRFRRGIMLDDGQAYLLGDDIQFLSLQLRLMDVLFKVFNLDEKSNRAVLKTFLHLK